MSFSKLDRLYRTILLSKFFTKGWGDPQSIKRLIEFREIVRNRETCHPRVPKDCKIVIDKEEVNSDCIIMEGHFRTPFADYLPDVVPKESQTAYFQMLLPKQWRTHLKPVCLFLAGTGDHHFWRRRNLLAKPLLKESGIGSIILENPFYGLRKPKDQVRSSLHNVSDIFVMGGCLAFESSALFLWCEKQGFGPLGVSGISMGGHMASIAASVWPRPIALIPCLSWTTASCVFTQGVMSGAIPWTLLEDQYFSNCVFREELTGMMSSLREDEAFKAGKTFIKNYSNMQTKFAQLDNPNLCEETRQGQAILNMVQASVSLENDILQSADVPFMQEKQSFLGTLRPRSKDSRKAAIQFMRGIMDEFTHLSTFSCPVDPSLIIVVVAKSDGYVLRDGITDLRDIWPGAEVRYIDAGHITAFLFKQSVFRKAIIDAFERMTTKYYSNSDDDARKAV